MIADYNTMPMMFWECNDKYFGHSLPTPKFGLMKKLNLLARFEYYPGKRGKHPIKRQRIMFSEYYDFDEETFRNMMVHEMIHYYIAWNRIKDNRFHGKEFMKMANEMKAKYGLNITKTIDASTFKLTEKAPQTVKKKNIFAFLFR